MRFYATEKLSPRREKTLAGFLICRDVAIARTGTQIYGPGQTPIDVGANGTVIVDREASEVFRPETMDSFNGAPFVVWHFEGDLSHPKDADGEGTDVLPENWKQYTAGHFFNVRRGSGEHDDLLLADLFVYDAEAMRLIEEEGFTELSAGYDSNYVEDAPGRGRQVNILGNHVALVAEGRCGERCSIRDSLGGRMATKSKFSKFRDGIMKAFASRDEAAVKKMFDEAEDEDGGDTHIHIEQPTDDSDDRMDALEARIAALEGKKKTEDAEEEKKRKDAEDKKARDAKAEEEEEDKRKKAEDAKRRDSDMEEDAPEGTADAVSKATDSALLESSFRQTLSDAEIVAPGIAFPTFDAAAKPQATFQSMTEFRRRAIAIHSSTTAGAVTLEAIHGRVMTTDSLAKLKPSEVRTVFRAVALAAKNTNAQARVRTADVSVIRGSVASAADANRAAAEFWKTRQ